MRDRARGLELGPLAAVGSASRWVPDFLAPPPTTPSPDIYRQLREIARTPLDRVEAELARCRAAARSDAYLPVLDELLADPAVALRVLVDSLADAWRVLVAPVWPAVSTVLDADIAYRTRLLGRRGLAAVLAGLHPSARHVRGAIEVDDGSGEVVELGGRGLVLLPSAFFWSKAVAIVERPWQPTVAYPARGVAAMWRDTEEPSRAVGRLLGRTRALVLASVGSPSSTTGLAQRLDKSPATISAHLLALREAGLIGSARYGHEVRYVRTRLGTAVLRGSRIQGGEVGRTSG